LSCIDVSGKVWYRSLSLCTFLILVAVFFSWWVALPRVHLYYSKGGSEDLSFVWDTQHRVYRGQIRPGGITGDTGHIFPQDDFFMVLFWSRPGRPRQCVSILPKWPFTSIYIDAEGDIDMSTDGGTDISRLKACPYE
jgi:hypothetical protein